MKSANDIITSEEFIKKQQEILKLDSSILKRGDFLKLPNRILYNILFNKELSKREVKAMLLILRCTLGCQKVSAEIKRGYFALINIYFTDATEVLKNLEEKGLIQWDMRKNIITLTVRLIHKEGGYDEKLLSKALSQNLAKHSKSSEQNTL
ncbi:MAG: replication protein [Candidatus Dojkabacteria bacterium]